MKHFGLFAFLILLIAVWLFAPISKEQYLDYKPANITLWGKTIHIEIVADFDNETEKMRGTAFIEYPKQDLHENNCLLQASYLLDGRKIERPRSPEYQSQHIDACDSDMADCNLKPGLGGRMHLLFSKMEVSNLDLTLAISPKSNPSLCPNVTKTIVFQPKWRRISRWDNWSAR